MGQRLSAEDWPISNRARILGFTILALAAFRRLYMAISDRRPHTTQSRLGVISGLSYLLAFVPATGFEPATFWSVARCSIR